MGNRICKPESIKAEIIHCIRKRNSLHLSSTKFILIVRTVKDNWNPLVRDIFRIQINFESQGLLSVFLRSKIKLLKDETKLDWHNMPYCIILYETKMVMNDDLPVLTCARNVGCTCLTITRVKDTLRMLIETKMLL
jgi:hypothetical protein